MKTLSFIISNGKIKVTGDSSKGTLVENDKIFILHDPSVILMDTESQQHEFIKNLLQSNHNFTHNNNLLVIDDIEYFVGRYYIENISTKNKIFFSQNTVRNFFNEYNKLFKFHIEESTLITVEKRIIDILLKNNINKYISDVEKTNDGVLLTITTPYTERYNSKYLNFKLKVNFFDQKISVLHFFEPEGEYYSSGEIPLTEQDILNKIEYHQKTLKNLFEITKIFNTEKL